MKQVFSLACVWFVLAAALLSGCAGKGGGGGGGSGEAEDPDSFAAVKDIHGGPYTDMVLVYLKTGPNSAGQSKEQSAETFKGHMANMHRLADAKQLLIAGPFEQPRDKAWRGIFVLDTPSVKLAELMTQTDPAVKSGVFVAEYQPIKISIGVRSSGELEKAMLARNADAGETAKKAPKDATKPPPNLRGYVMLTADDAAGATAALAKAGMTDKVVWCAKFSGSDKSKPARGAVFVLDAVKADDLQAALAKSGVPTTGLGLDGWWSSASLMGFEPGVRKLP